MWLQEGVLPILYAKDEDEVNCCDTFIVHGLT